MGESVYPAICGSFELHREHSWREGFLWNRKVLCLGSVRTPAHSKVGVTTENHFRELLGLPTIEESAANINAALIPMQIVLPPHKHYYRLTDVIPMGIKRPTDIVWRCDEDDCRHFFISDRDIWQAEPLGVTYDVKD